MRVAVIGHFRCSSWENAKIRYRRYGRQDKAYYGWIDRRTVVATTGVFCWGYPPDLRAQGQATPRRIGFISGFPRADIDVFLGFLRPELEKLGWTDGRDILLLEPRITGGDNARLPSLASELVAEAPDLILVQTVPATRVLMQATKSIPIVLVGVANSV
jgi:hypothetical protein